MKKLLLLTIFIFTIQFSYAQRYEVGFFVGGNNVIGDIGTNIYVAPYQPTFGGIAKWNKDERLAIRATLYHSWTRSVGSSKYETDYPHKFRNGIVNSEIALEWNIFDYNLRYKRGKGNPWTPYMFIGIGGVMFEKIEDSNNDGNFEDAGFGYGYTIPFGVGYKMAISHSWVVAADLTFRYVSSDDLDYSDTKELGNLKTNDWFTTIGVTFTYVFGRDACPCGQ